VKIGALQAVCEHENLREPPALNPPTLSRYYAQRSALKSMVRNHLRGERNYTVTIHEALALELLYRFFLDSTPRMTQFHPLSKAFAGSR
jgi:hypothetical protein